MKPSVVLRPAVILGLLVLVFLPLIVSSSLFFPFITGKAFAFRILVEIILGLWLILAVSNPAYRPRSSWLFKAYGLLLAIMVLATIFGSDPYHSFWSNFERMEGLVNHLHLFAYFIVLISVLKSEKLWGWLIHSTLAVNAIIAIYSLLQLTGKITINQGGARVDATFGNATYLAVYELFHIFFILILLTRLVMSGRWKKSVGSKILGASYLLLLLLDIFILFKTETRGTILGLIFGLLIAAIAVAWHERGRLLVRKWAISVGVAIVLLVAVFIGVRNTNFVRESPVLSRLASISLSEGRVRFMVWRMGLDGFKEKPILGWGPENYMLVFNKYYNSQMYGQEQWFDRSHNVIFDWLITSGLLGLLAYLSLFVSALYLLWRRATNLSVIERGIITGLLAGYFVHNIFVFDNLVSYLLFLGVLGYVHYSGTGNNLSSAEGNLVITSRHAFFVAPAVAVIIVIAIYQLNLKPIHANRSLIQALSWQNDIGDSGGNIVRPANPAKSLENFEQVFTYDTFANVEATEQLITSAINYYGNEPLTADLKSRYINLAAEKIENIIEASAPNARYYFFAGILYGQVGDLDRALERLEEAHRLSPKKQTITFQLANAYFAKGDKQKTFELLREAYELAPEFDQAVDHLINIAAQVKNYELVLKLWQEKVVRNPNNTQFRASLAAAFLAVGDRPQAIATLEEAIKLDPTFQKEGEFYIQEIKAGRNP